MSEYGTREEIGNPTVVNADANDDLLNDSAAEDELAGGAGSVGTTDEWNTSAAPQMPIGAMSSSTSGSDERTGDAMTRGTTDDVPPAMGTAAAPMTEGASNAAGSAVNADARPPANNGGGGGNEAGMDLSLDNIKQSASDAASSAKQQAGQALDTVKQQAGQALGAAKETAGQALGQAKDQIKTQLTQQKDRAADSLTGLTSTVHAVGDTLRQNNMAPLAEYTDSLTEQVNKMTSYLKDSDIDALARDADRFARENPAIVIAGALVLGIAIGRFLRSSGRGAAYTGERGALVPVSNNGMSGMSGSSVNRDNGRQDEFSDNSIGANKAVSAHDYVPGGVLGGAPA